MLVFTILISSYPLYAQPVVIVRDIQLRAEPTFDAIGSFPVKEGTTGVVIARKGFWLHVDVDGKSGWALTTEITFVDTGNAGTSFPFAPGIARQYDRSTCDYPLNKYCLTTADCPDYATWLRTSRNQLRNRDYLTLGNCGDLRFVGRSEGFVSRTLFFDSSGNVVAAQLQSDHLVPPCRGLSHFGPTLSCKIEITERLGEHTSNK